MMMRMMMIAVKPVIKAMSFDWLEGGEKESRTKGKLSCNSDGLKQDVVVMINDILIL